MSARRYFLRIAIRNLRRGGQRMLVALFCIAFGVMSLSAMTIVAQSIANTMVLMPAEQIGADLSIGRKTEPFILPEQVEALQAMQQDGLIKKFTLASYTSTLMFHTPGSGEAQFAASGIGIDPQEYPLAGDLVVGEPGNVGLATLLQGPGDLLITVDVAQENHLAVGDPLILSDMEMGASLQGQVRGIVVDTPNHQGSKIYYTLASAERLAGGRRAVNLALANAPDSEAARQQLRSAGWEVNTAQQLADNNKDVQEFMDLALKGAGILGLLVGGIGIANTMQVLLRRRRKEVAIWKTLGYSQRDLQILFVLEASLLGIAGSLLGALLGLAISFGLVDLVTRTGNLLIHWAYSPYSLIADALAGVLTTVIFAMLAMIATSRVQPLALLRNEPLPAGGLPWKQTFILLAILALPFTAITGLLMGSLIKGAGVLLFALVGFGVLGGCLEGLTWAASHLLALPRFPLVNLAQKSLRRGGLSLVFAMIALFTGVVSLAMGVVFTQNAMREMGERTITLEGYNLNILAEASQEAAIRQALNGDGIERYNTGYRTSVKSVRAPGKKCEGCIPPRLIGRSELGGYLVSGAPWGSDPTGVYAPAASGVAPGSQVEVNFWDGSQRSLPVVGTYETQRGIVQLPPDQGLLTLAELSLRLSPPEAVMFFVRAKPDRLSRMSASLGAALPQATVVDLQSFVARFTQTYQNLFLLAVAMASLALLAGVLLVANSVSLAMLDRRYEIGVLKAVGFSRAHVIFTLAVEYSLVALVPTVAALILVELFLFILARMNDLAASLLVMSPASAAWIGMLGVGLALATVLVTTWRPVQVSPIVILNDLE